MVYQIRRAICSYPGASPAYGNCAGHDTPTVTATDLTEEEATV